MAEEYIDVVNYKDEVIGRDLKSQKQVKGFIGRVVAIFIVDSKGKFIIHKKASYKNIDPDLYDVSALGHVISGETYEQAAQRELKEELNLTCPLQFLDKFYQEIDHKDKKLKIFCGVFLGITDQKPQPNHEISSIIKMDFNEMEEKLRTNPELFCQGFANDFNRVKDKLREIKAK